MERLSRVRGFAFSTLPSIPRGCGTTSSEVDGFSLGASGPSLLFGSDAILRMFRENVGKTFLGVF